MISGIHHDKLAGFVANEHIDWTNASSAFSTSSTGAFGNITLNTNTVGTSAGDLNLSPASGDVILQGDLTCHADCGDINDVEVLNFRAGGIITIGSGNLGITPSINCTGDVTCDEVVLTGPTQNWKFGAGASQAALWIGGQSANTNSLVRLYTTDGDATRYAVFYTYGYGNPGQAVNYEYGFFGWHVANSQYEFSTYYSGSGTSLRPLSFYTSGNANQIKLQTDGDVMMATIPTGATAAAAGAAANELWVTSSHATLPDGVVMRA